MKSVLASYALALAVVGAQNQAPLADSNANAPEVPADIGEAVPAVSARPTAMIEDVGLPKAKVAALAGRIQQASKAAAISHPSPPALVANTAFPQPRNSAAAAAAAGSANKARATAIAADPENNNNSNETRRTRMAPPPKPAKKASAAPPNEDESESEKKTSKHSDVSTADDESAAATTMAAALTHRTFILSTAVIILSAIWGVA
ncbi:hypothetical protein H4S06_006307 [Coemansia sp. BCRC 34490]|nr:hypothetical protein H4S06_006307 [Coemansia sp. BCRC 34490]